MKIPSSWITATVLSVGVAAAFPCLSFAQDHPRIGIGAKMSSLGIGVEATAAVAERSNVRGSFSLFNYSRTFNRDGINYDGNVKLRSAQITFDQYLVGILHISPGVLLYNGNRANANASVPAGQSFLLGDNTFFSNTTNPVRGTGKLDVRNVTPVILVGLGNLLPRGDKHFGMNFEAGIAFQGAPDVRINLAGAACALGPATACTDAATDPIVQSSILREQEKIREDLKAVKYYPVVSTGFSWRF